MGEKQERHKMIAQSLNVTETWWYTQWVQPLASCLPEAVQKVKRVAALSFRFAYCYWLLTRHPNIFTFGYTYGLLLARNDLVERIDHRCNRLYDAIIKASWSNKCVAIAIAILMACHAKQAAVMSLTAILSAKAGYDTYRFYCPTSQNT